MGSDGSIRGEITVAAWGDSKGEEWSFLPKSGISRIIINHGSSINSIMFKRGRDHNNHLASYYSPKFGVDGRGHGDRTDIIKLDFPYEFLTGISGSHSHASWSADFIITIRSLKFQTNRAEYGSFGGSGSSPSTPFSLHTKDGVIAGFHGRVANNLTAIGVYIMPVCSNSMDAVMNQHSGISELRHCLSPPPRSAGPWGSGGGREWDDGVFTAVKSVELSLRLDTHLSLTAVRFIYENKDGSDFSSPMHGDAIKGMRKTIGFNGENEFLVGIEGFHGSLEGNEVIRSLTFITNKAKYGPVGAEIGTYFTSMNFLDCNRKVLGFHGRSGAFLDAIGVHTEFF